MAKVRNVPGEGTVEFPDTMSDTEIDQVIKRKSPPDKVRNVRGQGMVAFPASMSDRDINQVITKAAQTNPDPEAPDKPEDRGFWKTGFEAVTGFVPGVLQAIDRPREFYEQTSEDLAAQREKSANLAKLAAAERKRGQYGRATMDWLESQGYDVAGRIPLIGPAAAQAAEDIGEGRWRQGTAEAATLLLPDLAKETMARIPGTKSAATPVQARRLAEFERRGGKTTVGQRMARPGVQKVERGMVNVPGSMGYAEGKFKAQEAALERQVRENVQQAAPTGGLTEHAAGEAVATRYETYANSQFTQGRALYQKIDQKTAQNVVRLQVGTRLRTVGRRTVRVPVYQDFHAPATLQPIRAGLRDLYVQLSEDTGSWGEAERQANPGFRALERVMKYRTPYMDATKLDQELSAIKGLVRRGGDMSIVATPSQRVALHVIEEGEKQVENALNRVDPALYSDLQKARTYWKAGRETVDEIRGFGKKPEPARLYERMTTPGDTNFELSQRIAKIAPAETSAVARTWLEGLLKKGFADTGRLKHTAGILRDWNELGDKTKELWFGKQLTQELDDVFHNMADIVPAEGSPTAGRLIAWNTINSAIGAGAALLSGASLKESGLIGAAWDLASMNILSRVLFNPGGARLIKTILVNPVMSNAYREAARALAAQSMKIGREEREKRESAAPGQKPRAGVVPRGGLAPLLADASRKNKVPLGLLHAMVQTESSGNTRAVSPKGAIGPMQLMPGTAQELGVDPADPRQNVEGGARYMAQMLQRFGNLRLALAAYNAGPAAVDQYHGIPPFKETQDYVKRVLSLYH